MRREDVIKRVHERLKRLEVPAAVSSVRKIPSYVEVNVLTGCDRHTFNLRTGITSPELEYQLGKLEGYWQQWKLQGDQIDIEEAIAKAKGHG